MPRISKIAKLPPELRSRLQRVLASNGYGEIHAATEQLNEWLAAEGLDTKVGKSAVGEEAKRLKRLQENIQVTTESARVIAEMSRDDGDVRSEAIMATVQTDIWKTLLELREADSLKDPLDRLKALTKAGTSVGEMSRARVSQAKWRIDVDAKIKAAEEKITKLARKAGADPKTVAEIRATILGITQRLAPAA